MQACNPIAIPDGASIRGGEVRDSLGSDRHFLDDTQLVGGLLFRDTMNLHDRTGEMESDVESLYMDEERWRVYNGCDTMLVVVLPYTSVRKQNLQIIPHLVSAFDVVDESEVLSAFLHLDDVHESRRVSVVGAHTPVDFDEPLGQDLLHFRVRQSVLETISQE